MKLLEERYDPCKFWEKETTILPTHVVVPHFLSDDECDRLLAIQDAQEYVAGKVAETDVYSSTEKGVENADYRVVDVNWLSGYDHRDIYETVWDRTVAVNDEHFGFQIEQMQDFMLCRYGEGHFFSQHYDQFEAAPKHEFRKLTMTILLNDPEEFDGAIDIYSGEEATPIPHDARGAAIIFPSWALHAVEPIRALHEGGTRRVMICWFVGDRYR